MTVTAKRLLLLLTAALALAGAFAAGKWWGSLSASLEQEGRYPWDLHRKMATADMSCERFLPNMGSFMIKTVDDGKTLIARTLDRGSGMATVYAIDHTGKFASDTFSMDCRERTK
jgi:hypothetical protein